MSKNIMRLLYSYCEFGQQDDVEDLLRNASDEIDFESEDYGGEFLFLVAMSSKNAESIIRLLVDFYQKYKIDIYDQTSYERILKRLKFGNMLLEAYKLSLSESENIYNIVNRYTTFEVINI